MKTKNLKELIGKNKNHFAVITQDADIKFFIMGREVKGITAIEYAQCKRLPRKYKKRMTKFGAIGKLTLSRT